MTLLQLEEMRYITGACDLCDSALPWKRVLRIGFGPLICAECLRNVARELDRQEGK